MLQSNQHNTQNLRYLPTMVYSQTWLLLQFGPQEVDLGGETSTRGDGNGCDSNVGDGGGDGIGCASDVSDGGGDRNGCDGDERKAGSTSLRKPRSNPDLGFQTQIWRGRREKGGFDFDFDFDFGEKE
ncbi:hypothetical protein SLEP1_g12707 [Rubroshorea leprosula]|uniref:Uncharacterized protein n=1 Tax=Rubroshorea leprosula TaxID=152421 RepID=A0AAV5IPS3_9ROSI|nr:hypothetical protein SLEP1_g12707 [Rubroshorea leprosula]